MKETRSLIHDWYKIRLDDQSSLGDSLIFCGLSLWDLVEWEIQYDFIDGIIENMESGRQRISIRKKLRSILARYYVNLKAIHLKRHAQSLNLVTDLEKEVSDHRKILIITYVQNHIDTIAPVIEELEKDKKSEILIIAFGVTDQKQLQSKRIPYKFYKDYVDRKTRARIKDNVNQLSKTWHKASKNRDFRNSFTYKNMSLWGMIETDLTFLFRYRFRDIISQIEIINSILTIEKPDVVIALNDVIMPGRAAVKLANSRSIPTLTIQHGIIALPFGYTPVSAQKMAVWGEASQKLLVGMGENPAKLFVTGAPQYDDLFKHKDLKNRQAVFQDIDLDLSTKMILLATDCTELNKTPQLLPCLLNTIDSIDNCCLVIKPHPGEGRKKYERFIKKGKHNVIVSQGIDMFDLLNASDAVITIQSTVGLEAIILDKPLITINLTGKPDNVSYAESEVAIGVHNEAEINSALRKTLNIDKITEETVSQCREKFLSAQLYRTDGCAARRIADLVKNMFEKNRRS